MHENMPKFVQQVKNQLLKNFYMVSFIRESAEISYHHALENHKPYLPAISASEYAIIQALQTEGVAVTSLDALGINSSGKMFNDAQHLIPDITKIIPNNWSEYVIHATNEQIMNHPSIFMWGLEAQLLNLAENYLGLPVAYHGAYVRRDLNNLVERKSRCWHIDREDRRMFKIIIYLNDVDSEGGAFEYIPGDLSGELSKRLHYKYDYIRNQKMQTLVSPSSYQTCTGAKGTVIIADTGKIFHRGRIPLKRDRFAVFYDYTSRYPQYPFYCKSSLPEADLLKLAMNMSSFQKECVFWRNSSVIQTSRTDDRVFG